MPYNKFKIETLKQKLGISVQRESWLPELIDDILEDDLLMRVLSESEKLFLGSEKARSEFIVAPVLQAFKRRNMDKLTIFSGYEFNIDKSLDLNGYCDFILSSEPNSLEIEAPAFLVVETKKLDIDNNAIAQCGAEMYAAMLFNERENKPSKVMYGCVTSGFSWGFLKLENKILSIDANYVPFVFKNPYMVLNMLEWVFNNSLMVNSKE